MTKECKIDKIEVENGVDLGYGIKYYMLVEEGGGGGTLSLFNVVSGQRH
jgi:hypothetical protein